MALPEFCSHPNLYSLFYPYFHYKGDFVMEGLKASEEEMERRDRWRAAAYDLEMPAIYAANLLKRRAIGPLPKRCLSDQAKVAQWFLALGRTTLIFPE